MTIRAFILLAGAVRRSRFLSAVGGSVLALPVLEGVTLAEHWVGLVREALQVLPQEDILVRVVKEESTPRPEIRSEVEGIDLRFEEDPFDFRGTAGVIADLCRDYDEGEYVLVGTASQPPRSGLREMVARLSRAEGDARLLIAADRAPTGLYLIRCGVLGVIPEVGFVDLKEQGLPLIARDHLAKTVGSPHRALPPIRDRESYLSVVRAFAREPDVPENPFREDWQPEFVLVSPEAVVAPSARIHDSVILSGAEVGERAVVARCVVCPGVVVRRGEVMVDQTVGNGGRSVE